MTQSFLEQNSPHAAPPATATVERFILQQLEAWGVERIYGVIGDSIFSLLDELAKTSTIRYIPCRHEEAAALMASAEAKLTGRLTVCMATSGPGTTNLLNGLADAAMDHAPVLAITGQVPTDKLGTGAKQDINQQALLHPIATQSQLLADAKALPELLNQLMTDAVTQGAVTHLSIPKNLYGHQVPGSPTPYRPFLHQTLQTPLEPIQHAASLIATSQRPAIYMGRGTAQCRQSVRLLAEKLDAAVVTTMPARSLYPNDDPRFAGGLGQAGSEASSRLLGQADLVLMLGATWWPDRFTPSSIPIVQIDRVAAQIGINHPVQHAVIGDLNDIMPKLIGALGAQPDRTSWRDQVTAETKKWKAQIEAEARQDSTPLEPQRIIRAIADHSADNAILSVDTGDVTLWFERIFQAQNHDILISGRWRTLGFALPSAIAAKLKYPERQSIAIAGDGGAIQTLLELQTASQHKLALTLIILDNGAYAMEKTRMEVANMQTLGSELVNPDFCKLAEACGAKSWYVDDVNQLDQALHEALATEQQPSLLQVKTAMPMVPHTKP